MKERELNRQSACESMGGIRKVEFCNARNVTVLDMGGRVSVVMGEGAMWLPLDVRQGDAEYTSNAAEGMSVDKEVTVRLKGMSNLYDGELRMMRGMRWILRVTDNAGIVWYVGTTVNPMRMEYNAVTTGGVGGERL